VGKGRKEAASKEGKLGGLLEKITNRKEIEDHKEELIIYIILTK